MQFDGIEKVAIVRDGAIKQIEFIDIRIGDVYLYEDGNYLITAIKCTDAGDLQVESHKITVQEMGLCPATTDPNSTVINDPINMQGIIDTVLRKSMVQDIINVMGTPVLSTLSPVSPYANLVFTGVNVKFANVPLVITGTAT